MDKQGFEIVEAFVRFLSFGEFSEENTKGNTHTIIRMIRHLDEKAESGVVQKAFNDITEDFKERVREQMDALDEEYYVKKPEIDAELTEYIQKRHKDAEEQLAKCNKKIETKSDTVYFTPESSK